MLCGAHLLSKKTFRLHLFFFFSFFLFSFHSAVGLKRGIVTKKYDARLTNRKRNPGPKIPGSRVLRIWQLKEECLV